ncbi:hypothetical protein LOCC1_G001442 [Lachnellula occidentalis]|uniref:Uncharacterized protein n=1 Tax=Lachnellula occidentalis TaxID=215460 RepID=A0A8H8S7M2_9HELO|nr:hypothetical protein LOCC1_G001442 [Lachnellula occidentalis]
MAQVSGVPSGQNIGHTTSIAPARTTNDEADPSRAGLAALKLVELAANPVVEGVIGTNQDKHIRNAVPSKLKGKTNNKQGNFGVMHMEMSAAPKKSEAQTRDAAAERDAAARRTSENTESRAKAAQQQRYAPPKKKGLEATISEATRSTNRGSPFARDDKRQQRPLAPDETKMEQARLLTLLRSINPVTVVDQICKAVAYFGGIPGAPPPEDGIFPESANTRETGALFIGWLAEIFPDVTAAKSPEVTKSEVKKKGRPFKGPKNEASVVEIPNSRNGYGFGAAVSAPAWGLPPNLAEVVPQAPRAFEAAMGPSEQPRQSEPQPQPQPQPSTPLKLPEDSAMNTASGNKRRRGRPKGSTNKKLKMDGLPGDVPTSSNNVEPEGQNQSTSAQMGQPAEVAANTKNVAVTDQSTFQPAASNSTHTLGYSEQSWQNDAQKIQMGQASDLPPEELSPEEQAVLEAFRAHNPEAAAAVPSPVVSAKGATGQPPKRKRAPAKPKVNPAKAASTTSIANPSPSTNFPVHTSEQMPHQISPQVQEGSLSAINNESVMGMPRASDQVAWAPPVDTTPTAPPAKRVRQRKPKVPNAIDPPSRTQTASVANSATPPIAPSTIPDSTASSQQSIQQSMPVSRPPAEGLEAHYERFANLQQQQNGRSHTPTVPQQQQHVRQPSKPASVPPLQTTPQLPQQMQHQASQPGSQQNSQRDDQKMTQGSGSRSSTSYFNNNHQNQRSQSTTGYSQQYPTHQPSNLYGGHSASPQMSNASYNRTASTHTLAQASPQFSQADNTFRTASPHTITQPTPSPYQSEAQFRAANTQIVQPSPSYSQPENSYRTPSTHSMAQPSPSYSTARTQQPSHQSHYSQFSDSSYIDLPTLESLGHSSGYGQSNLNLGTTSHSRSSGSTGSIYGTSGLNNNYDTTSGANNLLRVSRGSSVSNNAGSYGSSGAFDASTATDHDLREKLLRNIGGR